MEQTLLMHLNHQANKQIIEKRPQITVERAEKKPKKHQSKNGWSRGGREQQQDGGKREGSQNRWGGRQTECRSNTVRMREGREVDDWGQKAVLGKGRNRIKEHSCIKKAQMREERKRRSDKRKASTKEANKENPKGGINHCPTYPSSLRFLSFIERFLGPCLILSPSTPFPPPPQCHSHLLHPSIYPSSHTSVHPSVLSKQHRPSHVCPLFSVQKNTFVYASICQRRDKSPLQNTSCNCSHIDLL